MERFRFPVQQNLTEGLSGRLFHSQAENACFEFLSAREKSPPASRILRFHTLLSES